MKPVICYVGLGGNLGKPADTLRSALAQLSACPDIEMRSVSRFFSNKPMGPQDQPDYVNAVACLATRLPADILLETLFAIERAHGRVRDSAARWGARTLDMDLLLYGNAVIQQPKLLVPHPGLCSRAFVVFPLLELAPDLVLPDGRSLRACASALSADDLLPLA